jgi:ribosome-binding protein aMBF1 (putative translation factor)
MPEPAPERWRNGRSLGRTIYRMVGSEASNDDALIGVMDTPQLAVRVVASVNMQAVQDRSARAVLAQTLLDLPRVLHDERTRRGLSVREAAQEIGCSFSTVSRLEAGLINTSIRGAIAVLWWLNGEDNTDA